MSDNLTALLIVAICVLGPAWLTFHYRGKGQSARQLNAEDASTLAQMDQAITRMENRIATLEQILDAEAPGWRAAESGAYRKAV